MISIVVTGIGCVCARPALESLLALPRQPAELIYAVDDYGREMADSDKLLDPASLLDPANRIVLTRLRARGLTNHTIVHGVRASRQPWTMVTHEDVLWPRWDYISNLCAALRFLGTASSLPERRRIVGVTFPHFQALQDKECFPYPTPAGVTQTPCICTTLLRRETWLAAPFSFDDGVWYDAALQEWLRETSQWLLFLRWPAPLHLERRAYEANHYVQQWQHTPVWGDFDGAFQKRYGKPFHRALETFVPWKQAEALLT